MPTTPNIPYRITAHLSDTPEVRPAPNANWQARREVAAALRRLNNAVLTADVPTDFLQTITAQVEAAADIAESHQRVYGNKSHALQIASTDGVHSDTFYELTPALGQSNAVAPPMHVWQADGCVHAEVSLNWSYEGPFGLVHGGIIALLFDQLLGVATLLAGGSGRTATLNIRYHHPTPLNQPLRLMAKVDRVEGRKQFILAELWVGELCTASCDGLLIAPRPSPETPGATTAAP